MAESKLDSPNGAREGLQTEFERLGRYVLSSRIGEGGMGLVYAAYDPELNRKVAVKILRPRVSRQDAKRRDAARARLTLEAQALAQLAHPNIVPIYDVGQIDGELYLTMELLEGRGLDAWLQGEPAPSWRQIVEVFAAAADGLQAAHDQGIVHHDFKPENVLIAPDGRVRIVDFGLAGHDPQSQAQRLGASASQASQRRSGAALTASASSRTHSSTYSSMQHSATRTVAGTPSYMSPEQHAGEPTDALSDQYAFCVSLYEALYGLRPFAGDDLEAMAQAKRQMQTRRPAQRARLPRWLRKLVLRGLAHDPSDRHASMADLARQLHAANTGRQPWLWASAGACTLAMGLLAHSLEQREDAIDACDAPIERMQAAWDLPTRARIEAQFQGADTPDAKTSFTEAASRMHAHVQAWTESTRRACHDTFVGGTMSHAGFDLRMECLSAQAQGMKMVISRWLQADATAVSNAADAMTNLSDPYECDDPEAWIRNASLPRDPKLRATAIELEAKLLEARLSLAEGQLGRSRVTAQAALEKAERLGLTTILADAHLLLAIMAGNASQKANASHHAHAAVLAAEASGDDRLAAKVITDQLWIRGYQLGEIDEAPAMIAHAQAHLARIPEDLEARVALVRASGALYYRMRHFDEAADAFRQLIELGDSGVSVGVATQVNNLALSLQGAGRDREAEQHYRRAMAMDLAEFGRMHAARLLAMGNFARFLIRKGAFDEALQLTAEARAIAESTGAEAPMRLQIVDTAHARLLAILGRESEAVAMYEAKLEDHLSGRMTNDESFVMVARDLIDLRARLGRVDADPEWLERIRTIVQNPDEKLPRPALIAIGRRALAQHAMARGRLDEAQMIIDELDGGDEYRTWEEQLDATNFPQELELRLAVARRDCAAALRWTQAMLELPTDDPVPARVLARERLAADAYESCGLHDKASELYERLETRTAGIAATHSTLRPRFRARKLAAQIRAEPARAPELRAQLRELLERIDPVNLDPKIYEALRAVARHQKVR